MALERRKTAGNAWETVEATPSSGSQPTIYTGDGPINGTGTVFALSESTPSTSGTFTLTFRGETTVPIAFDAVSEDIASALQVLATVDFEVRVKDGYEGEFLNEDELRFVFTGALQGPTENPTVTDDLTDNGVTVSDISTGETGDPASPVQYDLYVSSAEPFVYVFDGVAWAVTTVSSLAITTAKIADGAVTTAKIAGSAVESDRIANGGVHTVNIADYAISSLKLGDDAVTTAKIVDSSVTTAKIVDDAVTAAKIAAAEVGTSELATGAVTTAKIGAAAVDTAQIQAAAVTSAKIASGAVTNGKVAADAVDTAQIKDNAVTGPKIPPGEIGTTHLGTNCITADKMGFPVARLLHGSTIDQLIDALIAGNVMAP